MNESDLVRFRHMLDAAYAAQKFMKGKTRISLDTDQEFEFAVRKAVEIIGEAASKVTSETRDQYPQIDWKRMVGMRNILIHAYFDVDLDQVWKAVTEDIPPLIAQLEKIIPPDAQ